MNFTPSSLKDRPYRYYVLLHDFIEGRAFTVGNKQVVFEYMGDSRKFYTPTGLQNYAQVAECLVWMKSANIFFKAGETIYQLPEIEMPHDYEHGSRSEFYHIMVALGILTMLSGESINRMSLWKTVGRVLPLRQISLPNGKVLDLDVNLQQSTLNIISDHRFFPLLYVEMAYAKRFVDKKRVTRNLIDVLNAPKGSRFILQIGENRNVAIHDVKLFWLKNGVKREIHLDHNI